MARPAGLVIEREGLTPEDETKIALRALAAARRCGEHQDRIRLYDIAVAHLAALAARIEREKREGKKTP